jgi:hypothetical protein
MRKKVNKTKQTRGAQPYDRVPYQNRVNRNGIPVVPYVFRDQLHPEGFAKGYRILVKPQEYFSSAGKRRDDFDDAVVIGQSAFLYYDNRKAWTTLPPLDNWKPCLSRDGSGHYIVRVPATTSVTGQSIVEGKPQGIRFFEYATNKDLEDSVAQLAWLAWHTEGIENTTKATIPAKLSEYLASRGLDDTARMIKLGAMDRGPDGTQYRTICPLCLEP